MSDILNNDTWLTGDDGPAAFVIREHLMPVEGHKGVIFPPTFVDGGYNIDPPLTKEDPWKTPNVCFVDSVGSQANRIEPQFKEERYAELIPQIEVTVTEEKKVNILDAGHRAGDALLRYSELQDHLRTAFKSVLRGNAEPLAKIAPTSLVFGVWDSRDTQAKLPRLVSSVIRAFNVREMTRSAGYVPPVDYFGLKVFSEEQKAEAEATAKGDSKNPLAKLGFVHHPPTGSHGGVVADGGIRRDATLSIAALQQLNATDDDSTLALRRYILGLSLVALTMNTSTYLRSGCNIVIDPDKPREFCEVYRDGRREDATLSHEDAIEFAKSAAHTFEVGKSRSVLFKKGKAEDAIKPKPKSPAKKKK